MEKLDMKTKTLSRENSVRILDWVRILDFSRQNHMKPDPEALAVPQSVRFFA